MSTPRGLKWLDNKCWSDITRDERFFCAHLYKAVLEDEKGIRRFVRIINESCSKKLPEDANWELGYEVCFYRDLRFYKKDEDKKNSLKRTFDLCLFSDEKIVIIEAKAYQPFDSEQTQEFVKDKEKIEALLFSENHRVEVDLIPIASSLYKPTYDESSVIKDRFKCDLLTWDTLAKAYTGNSDDSRILANADHCYKSKNHVPGYELLQFYQKGMYREIKINPDTFWVGRKNGPNGLKSDLGNCYWKKRLYEFNSKADSHQNKGNWFSLKEFAEIVSPITPASNLSGENSENE